MRRVMKPFLRFAFALTVITVTLCVNGYAQDIIKLPSPKIRGQVMKAQKNRTSVKGFKTAELTDQTLSDLLWAGFGVADQKTGKRTASSAFNANEIDIYVVRSDGVFLYDPFQQSLRLIRTGDKRALLAGQNYAKSAPVHLVFVADYARAKKRYPKSYDSEMKNWAMMHTGFIAQNIILYCSVNSLSAVVRSVGNEDTLRKELELSDSQELLITQAIGYSPR